MKKTYTTQGLDQLGTLHWSSEYAIQAAEHARRARHPQTLNHRANASTAKRNVKITLASPASLAKLLED